MLLESGVVCAYNRWGGGGEGVCRWKQMPSILLFLPTVYFLL